MTKSNTHLKATDMQTGINAAGSGNSSNSGSNSNSGRLIDSGRLIELRFNTGIINRGTSSGPTLIGT